MKRGGSIHKDQSFRVRHTWSKSKYLSFVIKKKQPKKKNFGLSILAKNPISLDQKIHSMRLLPLRQCFLPGS